MKVRYSFSSRRNRNIDKIRKQRQKYPGLAEKIVYISDIVLEVLDARFYESTRNRELEKKISKREKIIIYVINKSDLITKEKQKEIKRLLKPSIIISCTERRGINELRNTIKRFAKQITKEHKSLKGDEIIEEDLETVNVGVIGYPNTGKSSLMNVLIGRSSAGVGSDAGFTRGVQKIKLSKGIILIDTPGVIPKPDYSSSSMEKIASHTILGGRSYSQVKEPEIVIQEIMIRFPGDLEKYYEIESNGDAETLIEELGKKRNLLKKGGLVNTDTTARSILKDWQLGKIRV